MQIRCVGTILAIDKVGTTSDIVCFISDAEFY